ncbi:uncharacterized protein L3040_005096 [Drepanopeziza brunnea f. sp. 'multigermtubi']|nr:hypothetical protein L3040_005096 [Drepanopeziza brunnea f. sp. 'multigermtubi']
MSGINPKARGEVNDALISAGSDAVGMMVDAANYSLIDRRKNQDEHAKRELAKEAATEEVTKEEATKEEAAKEEATKEEATKEEAAKKKANPA